MASNLDFIHTLHELRMGIGLVEVEFITKHFKLGICKAGYIKRTMRDHNKVLTKVFKSNKYLIRLELENLHLVL